MSKAAGEEAPIDHAPPAEEGEEAPPPAAEESPEEMPEITFFTHLESSVEAIELLTDKTPKDFTSSVSREHAVIFEKFERDLDTYLEAPQVVRPHLEKLVPPLVVALRQRMPTYDQLKEILDKNEQSKRKEAEAAAAKLGAIYDDYDSDAPKTSLHHFSRLLYCVAKVVGNTNVTGHFPTEVMAMESVFHCLVAWQGDVARKREWEVRYCMLLWLSNLILAPFALPTLDSSVGGDVPLSKRMLQCAQSFLGDPSKCREGAALFVGRMMTRPDALNLREEFFTFAARATASFEAEEWTLAGGTLLALATTLKLGKREEMIGMACQLIPLIAPVALTFPDATVCQTAVKTVQRLGLVCMPPRAASWRYKRTIADLEVNLESKSVPASGESATTTEANNAAPADGEEDEVPAVIEDVLDVLIRALSHQDTIVRWSAAKGIGLICERLPQVAMEDVLQAVLSEFESKENDSGWHGACLALAEMAKRSTLLPESLEPVIGIVEKGLQYDVSRGSYSVGAHVRDAACYVCWSLARAYEVSDLAQWVDKIASSLVVAAVFDREVNVRRASSAAFQECVGRLGNFPDGISLVTIMDFFSLGTLRHAFLEIAPKVAEFRTYLLPLANHLMKTKFWHWDRNIRQLAAQSFGKLMALFTPEQLDELVIKTYLPTLFKQALNMSIPIRHGALSALTEILLALPEDVLVKSDFTPKLLEVFTQLHSKRLFRGRGGEWIRQVGCLIIKALATRKVTLPENVFIATIREKKAVSAVTFLEEFLEECWKQPLEWLQSEAAEAYYLFNRQFYTEGLAPSPRLAIVKRIIDGSKEGKVHNERRGCLLAMGSLQPKQLQNANLWESAFNQCKKCTELESSVDAEDAESRRNAVKSMVKLYLENCNFFSADLYQQADSDPFANTTAVFGALSKATTDYAVDKRGDVGSMVRSEAMAGFDSIYAAALCPTKSTLVLNPDSIGEDSLARVGVFDKDRLSEFLIALVKQAAEKIDRIRGIAGGYLINFLDQVAAASATSTLLNSFLPKVVPEYGAFMQIKDAAVVDWSSPAESFEALVPNLIDTPTFQHPLLEGMVLSVGGMSSHVAKHSLPVLTASFEKSNKDAAASSSTAGTGGDDNGSLPSASSSPSTLSAALCQVGRNCAHSERVVPPFFITVNKLIIASAIDHRAAPDLLGLLEAETKHFAKDVQRILPLVPALASLCLIPTSRSKAWMVCLSMVASRFPKVRAQVGNELYTALMMSLDDTTLDQSTLKLQEAMDLLAVTQWDGTDAKLIRSERDKLYPLLGLTKPATAATKETIVVAKKDDTSYQALVREAGY